MEWMILPLKRYFQISGRAPRREYWLFWVFTIIVAIIAGILDTLFGFGSVTSFNTGAFYAASWHTDGPLNTIAGLALLIPSVTVAVRRLHDSERSGWWLLLIFIPFFGWVALLIFMVMDGTRGANRYGPDPRDPSGGADAQEIFG